MPDFAGDFETHLTLRLDSGASDQSVSAWAERNGVKYTRIVLDRGALPDQPMVTCRGRGTLAEQQAAAQDWVERLGRDGFTVARIKIEAAPWNGDVPRSADEAAALPAGCYFEHHVKVVLADENQVPSVRRLVEPHAAHVSRNARRVLPDGRHERFVTQRCRNVGRGTARERLDALLAPLATMDLPVAEVEEEFVVFDDNPGVDAGWIDEQRTTTP